MLLILRFCADSIPSALTISINVDCVVPILAKYAGWGTLCSDSVNENKGWATRPLFQQRHQVAVEDRIRSGCF
jgi:hypothetical protein